jgi:orotate phosphoribosyltransferase-like protein
MFGKNRRKVMLTYKILQIMPAVDWYVRAIFGKGDKSDWLPLVAWALCGVTVKDEPGEEFQAVVGVTTEGFDSPALVHDIFGKEATFEYKKREEGE